MKRVRMFEKEHPGQGLIEFALVLPVLLLVTMGIIDLGRALFTYAQASNALRDALRYGGLTQTAGGGSFLDCSGMERLAKSVSFATSQTVTIDYRDKDGTPDPVTQELPVISTCPPADEEDIEQGDVLRIQNVVSVQLITPFFPQTLNFTLVGQRTIVKKITLTGSEEDTDFDGLSDIWECYNFARDDSQPGFTGYDPNHVDPVTLDHDYCPEDMMPALAPLSFDLEGGEFTHILSKYNATDDPDGDGCNNGCEEVRTTLCTTDPCWDAALGSPPDAPPVWKDGEIVGGSAWGWENPDSRYGPLDFDSDGDGLNDGDEAYIYGTRLLDVDSDDDGIPYGPAGSNQPEYATCQADDYEEAMGTAPHAPPSSSRTAHSDDDPATTPTPVEDGIDDWLEICRYLSDPTSAGPASGLFYLQNWPEATNCSGNWGLQWTPVSPVESYTLYRDSVNAGSLGAGGPYPLTISQCTNAGNPFFSGTTCPGSGPAVATTSYYIEAIWGLWGTDPLFLAPASNDASGLPLGFSCHPTVYPTIPNVPAALIADPRACLTTGTDTLHWDWDFNTFGAVDGFYIYAVDPSTGIQYRVGHKALAELTRVPTATPGIDTVTCTGDLVLACWDVPQALTTLWDPTVAWTYSIRPYVDTNAVQYEPMVGYESNTQTPAACPP